MNMCICYGFLTFFRLKGLLVWSAPLDCQEQGYCLSSFLTGRSIICTFKHCHSWRASRVYHILGHWEISSCQLFTVLGMGSRVQSWWLLWCCCSFAILSDGSSHFAQCGSVSSRTVKNQRSCVVVCLMRSAVFYSLACRWFGDELSSRDCVQWIGIWTYHCSALKYIPISCSRCAIAYCRNYQCKPWTCQTTFQATQQTLAVIWTKKAKSRQIGLPGLCLSMP
jgi:hypothetical protein